MDKVRFGRALGSGAREAARALMRAADAALTPDPRAARPAGQNAGQTAGQTSGHRAAQRAGQKIGKAGAQSQRVSREAGRFGRAVWTPFARASGVLWLEFTGVFFGLFAVMALTEVVRHRDDFALPGPPRQHVCFAAGMLALFGWFAASSFVRARRRSRGGRKSVH